MAGLSGINTNVNTVHVPGNAADGLSCAPRVLSLCAAPIDSIISWTMWTWGSTSWKGTWRLIHVSGDCCSYSRHVVCTVDQVGLSMVLMPHPQVGGWKSWCCLIMCLTSSCSKHQHPLASAATEEDSNSVHTAVTPPPLPHWLSLPLLLLVLQVN